MDEFLFDAHFSSITNEYPDRNKFPKYYNAKKIEFTICAGQKLFIPRGWFHWVFSETDGEELNVAVNYWYNSNNWNVGDEYTSDLPIKSSFNTRDINYVDMLRNCPTDMYVSSTNMNFVSTPRIMHQFPDSNYSRSRTTFDMFYSMKDKKSYIMELRDRRLDEYAPPYKEPLIDAMWWVNWGGITSGLHFDNWDNWLCQISGKKRVILFAPNEYDNLYTFNPYPFEFIKSVRRKFNST